MNNDLTLEEIGTYARALSSELSLGAEETSRLLHLLLPEITFLGERNDFQEYRIQMSRAANTLGAIMCADRNAEFHTGTGMLQTLPIIGMCAAVTSLFRPGYVLKRIRPDITFDAPIPIDAEVVMAVKETKARGACSFLELRGWINNGQDQIFSPRELVMVKIP